MVNARRAALRAIAPRLTAPRLAVPSRPAYIGAMKLPLDLFRRRDRVTVLRLEGVIGAGPRFGAAALTDAGLAPLIEAAFRRGKPKAVALAINSPGGSAGAVEPDRRAHPPARRREAGAGARLRRGRGGLGRLLAGDRRRPRSTSTRTASSARSG